MPTKLARKGPIVKKETKKCELTFKHDLTPKDKSCLTIILQDGFDASCASMIESAVEGGFLRDNDEAALKTMVAKIKGSPFSIAGGMLYRTYRLKTDVYNYRIVYEVLFMAVRPCAKRCNVASRMVEMLENMLKKETILDRILCVSIKESNEAKSFWSDMHKVEEAEDKSLLKAMIKFDDFNPVYKIVDKC